MQAWQPVFEGESILKIYSFVTVLTLQLDPLLRWLGIIASRYDKRVHMCVKWQPHTCPSLKMVLDTSVIKLIGNWSQLLSLGPDNLFVCFLVTCWTFPFFTFDFFPLVAGAAGNFTFSTLMMMMNVLAFLWFFVLGDLCNWLGIQFYSFFCACLKTG